VSWLLLLRGVLLLLLVATASTVVWAAVSDRE